MERKEELQILCEKGSVIRENYYSTTYRAEFGVNGGEKRLWDIQYIRIPFTHEKEEKLKARFGLSDNDLDGFYRKFLNEVNQSIRVVEELKRLKDDSKIESSTSFFETRKGIRDSSDGHFDIYIVSKPAECLNGSGIISEAGSMKSGILTLGARLLQSVKNYNDAGYSLGSIDLDSMLIEEKGGKQFIKNAFFPGATSSRGNLAEYTVDLTTHMHPAVAAGESAPSYNGDIYSVCSILWSMLNGQHYNTTPDTSVQPKYASNELYEQLSAAMNDGAGAYKELSRTLRQELNAIKNGTETDIVVPFASPSYAAAFAQIEEAEIARRVAEEAAKKADNQDDDGKKDDDKKKKLLKAAPIIAGLIVALTLFFIFYLKPMLFPEPVPTIVPVQVSTPAPTVDPDAGKPKTTSSMEGLYTYNDIIVDSHGVPTSRFYLNQDGDIVCEPSKYPARYDELELSDRVLDLTGKSVSINVLEDAAEISADTIKETGIRTGTLLMPENWDMLQHIRKVTSIGIVPADDIIKAIAAESGISEVPESVSVAIVLSDDEVEDIAAGKTNLADVIVEGVIENMSAKVSKESLESIKSKVVPEKVMLTLNLQDSDWYEEYNYCDDHTYEQLRLIEREPECDKIKSRVNDANGESISLYYDDAGNTYSEEEWAKQESLREKIDEAKKELDAYKDMEGIVIMVPNKGVEEFVYIEEISFTQNPVSVGLEKTTFGSAVQQSFMANVKIAPANATCKEILVSIDKEKGLNLPYNYNSEYITGEHNTYEALTNLTIDFSKSKDSVMNLALAGSEFGEYSIVFKSVDGNAQSTLTVSLTDSGKIAETENAEPSPSPSPTPTPMPTQAPYIGGGGGGGGGSYPAPATPVPTPVATPVPTPMPTDPIVTPTPAPVEAIPEVFNVIPEQITISVGESYDLIPSMSCVWSCSDPGIATIGGEQGRTVTGIAPGTCTITARASDGQVCTITITVI